MILLLISCSASLAPSESAAPPSCDDYCAIYQECAPVIPGESWSSCENQCAEPRLADEFSACMADAVPESGIEEYGADFEACSLLRDTCSQGVLAQSGD